MEHQDCGREIVEGKGDGADRDLVWGRKEEGDIERLVQKNIFKEDTRATDVFIDA